jgi:hypothetical protein
MTPERWSRLKDLFEQAVAVEPTRREWVIHSICDGDFELEESLRDLVAWHESATSRTHDRVLGR